MDHLRPRPYPVSLDPFGIPDAVPYDGADSSESPYRHPYRPVPGPTGELVVDPEIRLPGKGFGLDIGLYHSTQNAYNFALGNFRDASVFGRIVSYPASGDRILAQITRGDFRRYVHTIVGSSAGITTYAALTDQSRSTLSYASGEFTEWLTDGMKMVYATQVAAETHIHNLIRVEDPAGNRHTYAYTVMGSVPYLQTIELPGARVVSFHYEAGSPTSLLSAIQDWTNRRWTMQYDASRMLTTLTSPYGCVTKYNYDAEGNIAGIEDPRGYVTSYTFEMTTPYRVVSMILGSAIWNYEYPDPPGEQSVMISPTGARTTNHFTDGKVTKVEYPEGFTETMTYDGNGWLTKRERPLGVQTEWTWNSFGQMLTEKDALGRITTFQYDASLNLTTILYPDGGIVTQTFDSRGLRTAVYDQLGNATLSTYTNDGLLLAVTDARGLRTTFSYDLFGNPVTIMASDGGITTNVYDSLSRLLSTEDPTARITSFAYDVGDHMTLRKGPYKAGTSAALIPISTFVYDGCELRAEVDPLGFRTSYTYDRWGNRRTVKNALDQVTSFLTDNMGYLTTITNPLDQSQLVTYNAAKQKIADIDALGNRTTYGYDLAARLATIMNARGFITSHTLNARGDLVSVTDALGNVGTFAYDNMRRQIRATDPLGNAIETVYDLAGRVNATIDPLGNRTTFARNAVGNVVTSMNALDKISTQVFAANSNLLEATVNPLGFRTSYVYDLAGRQSVIIDPADGRTSMAFDDSGRMNVLEDPLGRKTTTTYDLRSQPATILDAKGQILTDVYDALGRLTGKHLADATRITMAYDGAGRRTTLQDAGGTTTATYSARGEITGATFPGPYTMGLEYDAVGNRTTLTDPDLGVWVRSYDALNRLTALTNPDGIRTTMAYDAASRETTILDGYGTMVQGFDAASRLTTMIWRDATNAILSTLVDSYNDIGSRIGRNEDGTLTTWVYDDADRLLNQQTASGYATFSYDSRDNILTKHEQGSNIMTFTVDAASQMVTMIQRAGLAGVSNTTYTYDLTGNLVLEDLHNPSVAPSAFRTTHLWDPLNRNVGIQHRQGTDPIQLSTYTWDGDMRRRSRHEHGGSLTTILYDGDLPFMEKT